MALLSPRPMRVEFARTARTIDDATLAMCLFDGLVHFLVLRHFGRHHVTNGLTIMMLGMPRGSGDTWRVCAHHCVLG